MPIRLQVMNFANLRSRCMATLGKDDRAYVLYIHTKVDNCIGKYIVAFLKARLGGWLQWRTMLNLSRTMPAFFVMLQHSLSLHINSYTNSPPSIKDFLLQSMLELVTPIVFTITFLPKARNLRK